MSPLGELKSRYRPLGGTDGGEFVISGRDGVVINCANRRLLLPVCGWVGQLLSLVGGIAVLSLVGMGGG